MDVRKIVKSIQNISFENAGWAYLIGAAAAIKKNQTVAAEIAETLGAGLQAFCIPGSVADDRKVGIGHGNLAAMLLREETDASPFARDTNRSLLLKVRSAWPAPRIMRARLHCA